jgi:hypothetical protein
MTRPYTPDYVIQQLDGYTDGRPSWRKVRVPSPWRLTSRENAEAVIAELQQQNQRAKYRARKTSKRR